MLVFVEGFPGAGKSTTAQWLAREWRRTGRACRWLYEQQPGHPVVGVPAGVSFESWDDYFDHWRQRWASFVGEQAERNEILVMESALLQYPILAMLRRDVPADTIVAFLRGVGDVVRPLAPGLVYLSAPDPDAAYRAIIARRGGEAVVDAILPLWEGCDGGEFFTARGLHGFDGLLAYWREHNAICEGAVEALQLPTLVVDPRRGDWPWRRAEIARFLGLVPAPEVRPATADLERWVGRYRVPSKGAPRECVVSLRDGDLVIDGVLWPANRLLPKRANVFDAEAWPFELVLESPANGGVGVARLSRVDASGPP